MLHEGDVANPVDRTLEYSRPLRSLRLWMAFRVHGAAQYRAWIERTLANARRLTELVEAAPDFELLHEPKLSTVCFRHVPPGVEDVDAHNVALAREMMRDGRIFLAPAAVDGRACLRACFVNFRTTRGRGAARARRGGRARRSRRRPMSRRRVRRRTPHEPSPPQTRPHSDDRERDSVRRARRAAPARAARPLLPHARLVRGGRGRWCRRRSCAPGDIAREPPAAARSARGCTGSRRTRAWTPAAAQARRRRLPLVRRAAVAAAVPGPAAGRGRAARGRARRRRRRARDDRARLHRADPAAAAAPARRADHARGARLVGGRDRGSRST